MITFQEGKWQVNKINIFCEETNPRYMEITTGKKYKTYRDGK